MSVPAEGRLVEVDVDLLGLEIVLQAVLSQLAPEARLLVAPERDAGEGGVGHVDPDRPRVDSLRDPVDEIVARERLWSDLAIRWRYRLQTIIVEESWSDNAPPSDFDLKAYRDRNAAYSRLLRTEFTIRTFQQDERRLPTSLTELTPKYLSSPLPDPYSGEPLRYKPSGDNFLLYSVGPDHKDNGGRTIKPGQKDDGLGYDIEL